MSPLQAMERSYGALKALLRDGAYPPGLRLEANRIADDVGVSMTPVRDALNRLVGERLVEASSGDGFHVPRLSEGDLRDLYEWHSALIIMAAQTTRILPNTEQMEEALTGESQADVTSACFALLAAATPNVELRAAIHSTGDRLHPYRRLEASVLEPILGELEDVLVQATGQRQAIRRYHTARMRAVPALVRARSARK
ncbi:GntR family transcriptional regulator [Sphingomonas suaedae]|uniref:GntR family transcriptional regulator n=1 Tax=Sphingomonas suaedae TaxID=2599297 RepID=A0A518RHE2_9SPHN|nr:GntR family transcriptional regulator [Sphingomonas suaedae]QDX26887.1 GntR family transcriptional regulator [Sphingomonas suaedae]